MPEVLAGWGPPSPAERGLVLDIPQDEVLARPGGVSRPPNGRGGVELWERALMGGCIGGGPTRPAKRPRNTKGQFVSAT